MIDSSMVENRTSPWISEAMAWRIIALLSVVEAGAYIGNEAGRYFWDLKSYVEALDQVNPYQAEGTFPFLYPPSAADLFTLARSHLFELMSIAYVAAAALFVRAFGQLKMPRQFEWLFAIFAMGGLGVLSLQSGNVAILTNLTVLALALQAAMGRSISLAALPLVIGLGALIKPQFIIYLGLLPCLEPSRKAFVKMLAVFVCVSVVYASYFVLRPDDMNAYLQAIAEWTSGPDSGWGPFRFTRKFTDSNTVALAGYVVGFLIVGGLSYVAWQPSVRTRRPPSNISLVSLAFVVLTFANPRLPIYDLFAAAIALAVCCSQAKRPSILPWTLVLALSINLIPWLIANFARVPSAYPEWLQNLLNAHLLGIAVLLVALSRVGIRPAVE